MSVKNIVTQLVSTIIGSKKNSTEPPSKTGSALQEKDGYYIWKKGEILALSKYFSTVEFACQCQYPSCSEQRISKTLITRLDQVRAEIAQPLKITSGFRCAKHQKDLVASEVNTVVATKSTHELGDAADIVPKDGKDVRGKFLIICEKHFESIGLSNQFLHVDLRTGKKRRWEY